MERKWQRPHIWHAYSTYDSLSNDIKVNDHVTLTMTFAFTCTPCCIILMETTQILQIMLYDQDSSCEVFNPIALQTFRTSSTVSGKGDSFRHFYAPGLKGPPGASSNRIVRPSVCPSVCLSVIPSRLQTKSNN